MFHAAHGAQPLSRLCLSAALVLRYAEQDSLKRLPEELRAQQDNGRRVDALLKRSRAVWACDRKCAEPPWRTLNILSPHA